MTHHQPSRRGMLGYAAIGVGVAASVVAAIPGLSNAAVTITGVLDETRMTSILRHPDTADHGAYGATDGAGNAMQSPSIVQLLGFGNPGVRIVDAPDGVGQVMWVSYFLFSEGTGAGQGGSLIYWTRI
jgi:hypothetical protein